MPSSGVDPEVKLSEEKPPPGVPPRRRLSETMRSPAGTFVALGLFLIGVVAFVVSAERLTRSNKQIASALKASTESSRRLVTEMDAELGKADAPDQRHAALIGAMGVWMERTCKEFGGRYQVPACSLPGGKVVRYDEPPPDLALPR